jgi:hypothetical protein
MGFEIPVLHNVLADDEIDCIVSDYDMPGMDSLEFVGLVLNIVSNMSAHPTATPPPTRWQRLRPPTIQRLW